MEIVVGKTESEEPVCLSEPQFRRGGYILGLSGTGKSTLEANAFLQVIGDEETRWGGVLLDPAGDLVRDVSRRIPKARREDVIYVDPLELREHPLALNPFAPLGDDADVDFLATEIMGVFRLLLEEYWDESLEAALRNVTMMLLASRPQEVLGERWWPALDEVAPLLLLEAVDDETKPWHRQQRTTYRETVWYPGLEEGDLAQVYQWFQTYDRLTPNPKARMANAIISKLDRFVSNPVIRNMVCQEGSIDFRQVINEGKILLVNLRQESLGDMSSFLASLIMAKLLAAVYHQTELETQQRPPFAIFADEFHSYATQSFLRLYQQGRKFGSTVFVAHTDRGWLRPWQRSALENAQNTFCFNLSPSDAWEMARIFDATPPPAEDEFRPRYRRFQGRRVATYEPEREILDGGPPALKTLRRLGDREDVDAAEVEKARAWIEAWARRQSHSKRDSDSLRRMLDHEDLILDEKEIRELEHNYEMLRSQRDSVDLHVQERTVYPNTPGTHHTTYAYEESGRVYKSGYSVSSETGPAYDRVPGRPRPYSDVYHQFANELCHQPDYQARCKLTGLTQKPLEVTIQSEPLGLENEDWQEDLGFFKERATQYGQPVGEVTEQLRRREAMRRKALESAQTPGGDGHPAYEAAPE